MIITRDELNKIKELNKLKDRAALCLKSFNLLKNVLQ